MDEEQQRLAEELLFSEKHKPSFAKNLFFGKCYHRDVLPFPLPSSDEEQENDRFIVTLKNYCTENLDASAVDRNAEIPQELIQGLGKLGVMGITVPTRFKGLGKSQRCYCQAIEVIASYCGATAVFVNAHQSIGLKAILLFGSDKQKEQWLPKLSKGEIIAAFSLTEPNAGSDAAGIETRAEYLPEKRAYCINGRKQWTTNGSIAGVLTLMAKTAVVTEKGVEDKVTAFIITPDMPGLTITDAALEKVGIRGTRTTNFELKNVIVPEENILGQKGGGLKVCLTALDYGRITFGAMCNGAGKFVLEKAITHAQHRYQFNRPLASFSLVKEKLARIAALSYAVDAATMLTAGLVDAGVEDVMLEAAILKVFASDALWEMIYETMQIYGGRSFFTDEPLERMMRDARLNMIGEGSNEVMRVFIAAVGMRDVGMGMKELADSFRRPHEGLIKLVSFSLNKMKTAFRNDLPIQSKSLKKEAITLRRLIKQFGKHIDMLLIRHREAIVEEQLQLNRMTDIAIGLYTSLAVLSKLDRAIADGTISSNELATGKYYCQLAFKKCSKNFKAVNDNEDTATLDFARLLTGGM